MESFEKKRRLPLEGRSLPVAVVVLVAVAAGAGCESDAAGPSAGRPVTGLVRCSVRLPGHLYIGLALPFTGSLAAKARSREFAVMQALTEINAGGGIRGDSLGLVSCDTRKEPATAAEVVDELAGASPLTGIVGPATSSCTIGAAQRARAGGIVMISPSATSPAITTLDDDGYVFRTAMSDDVQGLILARIAKSAPAGADLTSWRY